MKIYKEDKSHKGEEEEEEEEAEDEDDGADSDRSDEDAAKKKSAKNVAPPPSDLTELHRLAYAVHNIDHDCSVVPVGAYVLLAVREVVLNVYFQGF